MRPPFRSLLATALLITLGCQPDPSPPSSEERPDTVGTPARGSFETRIYERSVVFLSEEADSGWVVPWFFRSSSTPEGVNRRVRAALSRAGVWEPFLDEAWDGPPTRSSWRILPHGDVRIVVDDQGALTRIVYDVGARRLELELAAPLIQWTGPRGGTYGLREATLLLADEPIPGLLADVNRSRRPGDAPGGDWGVFVSGDSLQVIVQSPQTGQPPEPFRGYARLDFRDLRWPDLRGAWTEVRDFQPARRDVPVSFRWTTPDSTVVIEVAEAGAHFEVGEGERAQLPVDGLLLVSGTVNLSGLEYPVRGFLHHVQH